MPFTTTHRQLSNLWATLIPALYLILSLSIDYFLPRGTITPLLVVVGLLVMALFLRPKQMFPWVVIYTGIVCSIYLSPHLHLIFSGHPYWQEDRTVVPIVRAMTYAVVGGFSFYLCLLINSLERKKNELVELIRILPWPLVTADQNGSILYFNDRAQKLIPDLKDKGSPKSFFDLLAPPNQRGRTIADFLRSLRDHTHEGVLELELNEKQLKGYTYAIEWRGYNVVMVILSKEEIAADFHMEKM